MSSNIDCGTEDLTLIPLKNWVAVSVYGEDRSNYLQNQLTCDVHSMTENEFVLTSHCNSRGKVVSNLCLYRTDGRTVYVLRRDLLSLQLREMQRYAMFSKVRFYPDDGRLFGLVGSGSKSLLKKLFGDYPRGSRSVLHSGGRSIIAYGGTVERFLLVVDNCDEDFPRKLLEFATEMVEDAAWLELDIRSGYPVVGVTSSLKFDPLSLNIHLLGGISFTKGCYLGQEVVSRIRYKGIGRFGLYYLFGDATEKLSVGDDLEAKVGETWTKIGKVLNFCASSDGLHLQAVLRIGDLGGLTVRTSGDCAANFSVREIKPLGDGG